MIEKTVYVANDGKEFDCAEECLKHEFSLKDCSGIILADSNIERIPFEYDTLLENIAYIVVKNKESAILFQESCDHHGIVSPWDSYHIEPCTGEYFWDDNSFDWTSYENWKSDMLKQIQEKEEIFSKLWKEIPPSD